VGDHFGKGPAFQLGKRAGLDDANAVSDLSLIFLVMHVIFFGTFDDFVELWMGNTGYVLNNEGLVHFIGDDHANAGFTEVDLCVLGSLAHDKNRLKRWQGLSVLLGVNRGENLSGFAAHLADARWIFKRAGGFLKAKVESLLFEVSETDLKFVGGEFFGFGFGHGSDG
jgi:hypothetical protein